MKIACIGTGFVGVVTAAVLAKLGHVVVGLDVDKDKIAKLKEGTVPFFEPGLSELLVSTQQAGHLTFTTDYASAITDAEIVLIMVGTPSQPDGNADLKYVYAAAESSASHLKPDAIVVVKSTVPPGTNHKIKELISAQTKVTYHVASVPEFLKEGTAVADTLHPDRIVLGIEDKFSEAKLRALHTPLTANILVMKPESAQMCKYAANVYLAMRITFANQIADLCEKNGADVQEVLDGIGADRRIGTHYWYPGLGYGGSCFPKDVKEIAAYAKSVGETESIFIAVDDTNSSRIPRLMQQYNQLVGDFAGKTVAILGLSFKPNTNDTRVTPALQVIPWLLDHGATVRATDPQATKIIQPQLPPSVAYFADPFATVQGAHVVMLLTEWSDYLNLDLGKLNSLMQSPKYFFDTRNRYDKASVVSAGLQYKGIGR